MGRIKDAANQINTTAAKASIALDELLKLLDRIEDGIDIELFVANKRIPVKIKITP